MSNENETIKNGGQWDLGILYDSFDDPKLAADVDTMRKKIDEVNAIAPALANMPHKDVLHRYIDLSETISLLSYKLFGYANLVYATNTSDVNAAGLMGRMQAMLSEISASDTVIRHAISAMDDLEDLIATDGTLNEYAFFLRKIKEDSKYLLSEKEEQVFALMNISGASAWSDLHSTLTSTVSVDYRGEEIPLSAARNLAYDGDPQVRKDAYEAELACYPKVEKSAAFALNSIKLQVLNECRLRGFESPLDQALYSSRMSRKTLDALIGAMNDYMPKFREYLKAKGRALGHENGLPWYDMFAPMGSLDKKYTVDEAKAYLLGIFGDFDKDLHDMVKRAFEESWIDFFPRKGKVGGAFDSGVPSAKQSRVLTNFDGAFGDIVTLAHELGHAFHDQQVFSHSVIQQDYSMPVAETASTFNEVLVVSTAIERAETKEEKLALIESQLQDANQIITDIYSRYLFETSVFDNRDNEFMSPERMCELMHKAQLASYGDGITEDTLHPYMWLCKGHYYSGGLSFYNFPYAFGGLFARGLYALYKKQGKDFVPLYKALLHATSVNNVEDTAKMAGIDLTDKAFWCEGLQSLSDEIDEFIELTK
ncbi:MAG: M3 family oligoendopeptidase [Clostridia bacterium]|nr:M3 family oligoendopeptidase [Clostridia bacterium]